MSAPGLKITNFHYGHMTMPEPDPALSEYPKWCYPKPMGPGVLVSNAEEEAGIMNAPNGDFAPLPEPVPAPVVEAPSVTLSPDNDEKTVLLALAKEKGIAVDGRWRIEKLRAAMTAAQPSSE